MGHVLSFSSHLFQDGVIIWLVARRAFVCVRAARSCVAGKCKVFYRRRVDEDMHVDFSLLGYRVGSRRR